MNASQIRAKRDGRGIVNALASATSVPFCVSSQQAHFPVAQQYGEPALQVGGAPLQLLPWELLLPLLWELPLRVLLCDEPALDWEDPPPPPQLTGHSVSSSQHFQLPLGQHRSVLLQEGLLVPEQAPSLVLPVLLAALTFDPEDAAPEELLAEELRADDELGLLEERADEEREDERLLEDCRTTHGATRLQLMPWLRR